MIRKYTLVIEGDSAGYSGYVPELPTILVTGSSIDCPRQRSYRPLLGSLAHRRVHSLNSSGN